MKFLLLFAFIVCTFYTQTNAASNLVCFYDSSSYIREGSLQFTITDLERALQFCTHLIYGYVGINPDNFQVKSLNEQLDIQRRHLAIVTALKDKNPQVKFILSVGGDSELENSGKYINLLESGRDKQNEFIASARSFVKTYNFDGLDLSFQFPRNKARKVHSDAGMFWKGFKKLFTGDYIVDKDADDHKIQFTRLIANLKTALQSDNLLLSLTVLPNVNSSWYFDVPAIINSLDLVNLAAFDFLTPERNPEEADYTAPLQALNEQNRLSHYNVDYQVDYWLNQRVPSNKINVGVATYGRAWKLTSDSGNTGVPVVSATNGAAPAGSETKTAGLLNWSEICEMLTNKNGEKLSLRRKADVTKRYGTYGFRAADDNGDNGIWVSYDDPETAANKAIYAKTKNLGGIALFDITLDDFQGRCTNDKFPILRAIKYRLLY